MLCCSSGGSTACNQPGYLDRALSTVGSLNSLTAGPMTLSQIQSEVDGGRPVGVRIGWVTGGGHFIALSGYSDQGIVDVQDPWYGASSVDYTTLKSRYHGTGRWTHSYRTVPK